ncbi:Nucleotide-binding protein [Pseudoclavibacter triregionum]|nr:Nucleotide-binding protein [Pseudoclavibacter triregionum]
MTESPEEGERQHILVVTGMSGAGRSTACKALEDLDWFVVDNLPPQMIRPLIEMAGKARDSLPKLAVSIDIRGGRLLAEFNDLIASLKETHEVTVLFLDAADDRLVRRFESVRRPHPLQGEGTLLDGIALERERLAEIRASADIIIDTSELNVHELSSRITHRFGELEQTKVAVTVMSFGFKYGVPADADLVADMRFIPNPFWNPELRPYNGRDARVSEYVLAQEGAEEFLDAYERMLDPVLRGYERENKRHVTIGIGCTGGKHRSVAMTEALASRLRGREDVTVSVRHRDLGRE